MVPASAVPQWRRVRGVRGARAVRRAVKLGPSTSHGVEIDEGLIGGEDLIVNPPPDLKDGDRVFKGKWKAAGVQEADSDRPSNNRR